MTDKTEFKVEKRSINNKSLCAIIQKHVEDVITNGAVSWNDHEDREALVEMCEELFNQLEYDNTIDRSWSVICDLRNNKISDMDNGIYILELSYRQTHCFNTSMLKYTIIDPLIKNLKDLVNSITNNP